MTKTSFLTVGAGVGAALAASGAYGPLAFADATIATSSANTGSMQKPLADDEVYDQLISISAGTFSPKSAVISNGTYSFDYGSGSTDTFLVQAGWAARLFKNTYFAENVNYSRFSGSAASVNVTAGVPDTSLSVNLIGIDTRLQYALDTNPVHWLIPFVEGGYMLTFYTQSGSSDLDSVSGYVGNFVAGAGVRLWINRASSLDTDLKGTYTRLPVFLTLKFNEIFPNGGSLDLADSGFVGGLSVGL